jgi:Ca2+-binding EF-hand superfamily protein
MSLTPLCNLGKGDITFDNFVQACVTVKTLTDSFRQFDSDGDGWIQINYEQFLELIVRQKA